MARSGKNSLSTPSSADTPASDDAAKSGQPPIRHRQRRTPAAAPAASDQGQAGAADYSVGYRRPPRQSQFKPGTSGNPKGRPKGAVGLKTLVREMMTEKVPVRTTTGASKMTRVDVLLQRLFELALRGDARVISQILDLYAAAVPEAPLDASGAEEETDGGVLEIQKLAREFLMKARTED
jgi:hypothetical protein